MTKVLLVDDEAEFVEYMKKRMDKRGLKVDIANSGEQALKAIDENKYDVIVLDMLMPGMDGTQTLKEAKKRHPDVEVIMLTGHGTIESAVKGVKLGAFEYLLKPCEFDDLMATIEKASAKKRQDDERRMEERISNIVSGTRLKED